jgi:queuosine biosynthesis protein QueD
MQVYSVTREYSFCAAHRLEGHPKCGRLHGHNYRVEVEVQSINLSPAGMVIDFQDLDAIVKAYIDKVDHRYLVSVENSNAHDPYYLAAEKTEGRSEDVFLLATLRSTAESIAADISGYVQASLQFSGFRFVYVAEVRVWETPKSMAVYRP